jgi:hypothetical protein
MLQAAAADATTGGSGRYCGPWSTMLPATAGDATGSRQRCCQPWGDPAAWGCGCYRRQAAMLSAAGGGATGGGGGATDYRGIAVILSASVRDATISLWRCYHRCMLMLPAVGCGSARQNPCAAHRNQRAAGGTTGDGQKDEGRKGPGRCLSEEESEEGNTVVLFSCRRDTSEDRKPRSSGNAVLQRPCH